MKRSTLLVGAFILLSWMHAVTYGATESKKFTWQNDQWIPINLSSEGVVIKEIRFNVEGGIHWNPLRAGKGPQAFLSIKNDSDHPMHLAVAVALYDEAENLIAATEGGHIGVLDPGESDEIKMTFREVKRRFFDAKTGQVALETFK